MLCYKSEFTSAKANIVTLIKINKGEFTLIETKRSKFIEITTN